MQKLSTATKLKIAIPLMYLILSLLIFVATWPLEPKLHHVVGVLTTVTAFALWLVARVQLGNAFTIKPKAKFIVKSGLYSKFRHPIYYFSTVAMIGISIYVWQWPALVVILSFVILQTYRIRKEDQILMKQFGNDYVDYRDSTWI